MDDYCAYKGSSAGGERYSFSDLSSEDAQAIVKSVEKWQMEHPKSPLDKLVEEFLQNDKELNSSPWRKSFVKYPSAVQYCINGNFAWVNDGAIIYLGIFS